MAPNFWHFFKFSWAKNCQYFPLCYSSHSTLKKPLYDNAKLEAPDGDLLCVCDSKKALWYVDKGLGQIIAHQPTLTVRINFEPAGRPKSGNYYLSAKDNICVVCGGDQDCLRKYIVPHEFRKHFPEVMRDHQRFDIHFARSWTSRTQSCPF